MIRSTWTLAFAGVLVLAPVRPALAAELAAPAAVGEPTANEPRYATVEIDTSDVGAEGPVIKRRTRERTDVVLRAAGVLQGRTQDDAVIHVDIDELTGDEPGYQYEVWISRADAVVGERRRVECTLCTETEIVQRVETTVSELLPQLPTKGAAPEVAPVDDGGTPPPAGPRLEPASDSTSPTADEGRRGLGKLGKTGAALIAVGAVGAGVGVVFLVLPPKVDPKDPLHETTYRPPGAATLAAGAAVLVAGVVMLVVDRRRARKPKTALVPALSPSTAGLVWSGRF